MKRNSQHAYYSEVPSIHRFLVGQMRRPIFLFCQTCDTKHFPFLRGVQIQGCKVLDYHIRYYIECRIGYPGNNKKTNYTNLSLNRDTYLLSLINPSLANVCCSTILFNHGAIRLKAFIQHISHNLCNQLFLVYI